MTGLSLIISSIVNTFPGTDCLPQTTGMDMADTAQSTIFLHKADPEVVILLLVGLDLETSLKFHYLVAKLSKWSFCIYKRVFIDTCNENMKLFKSM